MLFSYNIISLNGNPEENPSYRWDLNPRPSEFPLNAGIYHDENRGKWKYFFDVELDRFGGKTVITGNLNKKDTIENLKIKNCFINEILSIWAEVNFDENIISEKQFLGQMLWHNSLIRIDNSVPCFLSRLV